ncbi:hypothetical protein [Paenibacillus agricola]|uniref:Uncharacterized protein n=1 Tax=Paenibacillus agricola TaxID=2716264 RepID=A0ABX0J702_9BACL|nr:hypothetical protein [Paenibacillus agricola]NHN31566.1 hypothetical protein [Paenibacillus agricola]
MLTFEQKLEVLESFPELQRNNVSMGRVNFHYEDSGFDKKNVAYHLHPNGNGYVYGGRLHDYETDDKGFVNIREYSAEELRALVAKSIQSLTVKRSNKPLASSEGVQEELWTGPNNESLLVKYEDELWYIYAGVNLESAFETYEEAEQYCEEEGFSKAQD